MTPQEIVHELDKYIVGQGEAKRAVAIALRNRWRRAAGGRAAAPGDHAEEHPDDRADRRRQDRDRAPPGAARRRAVHQGRGDQVHRGRLRRARRRLDRARPGRDRVKQTREQATRKVRTRAAGRRRGARPRRAAARRARTGRRRRRNSDAAEIPQEAARGRARRQGDRDRGRRRAAADGDPRAAGHGGAHPQIQGMFSNLGSGAAQAAQAQDPRGAGARSPTRRPRSLVNDDEPEDAGAGQRRAERHRVPRRDRQDHQPRRDAAAPTSRARACSATCCRWSRAPPCHDQATAWSRPTTSCSSRAAPSTWRSPRT